jgi:hypothetical protein
VSKPIDLLEATEEWSFGVLSVDKISFNLLILNNFIA